MIAVLLVACTAPSGSDDGDSATPVADTGDTEFAPPGVEPEYTADDVTAAIDAVMANGLLYPLDLYTWFDGVFSAVEDQSAQCPTRNASATDPDGWTSFWGGDCVGDPYSVSGEWQVDVTRHEMDAHSVDLVAVDLFSITGTAGADGELQAGGKGEFKWRSGGGHAEFELSWGGTFLDTLQTGGLGEGLSGTVALDGDYDGGFTGTYAGSVSAGGGSVTFKDLAFTAGSAGPVGTIQVRDPGSGWWEIALEDDGCGELSWYGEDYGEACPGLALTEMLEARLADNEANPP